MNVLSVPGPARHAAGLQLSERKILLGAIDLLSINAALAVVAGWWFGYPLGQVVALQPACYGVLTGVWLAVAYFLNSYDLRRAARLRAGIATGAATGLITSLVYLVIPYISPPLPISRWTLGAFLAVMVLPVTLWRVI